MTTSELRIWFQKALVLSFETILVTPDGTGAFSESV